MTSLTLTNEELLVKSIIKNGLDVLKYTTVSEEILTPYIRRLEEENLKYPIPSSNENYGAWLIPKSYVNLDIEQYLLDLCPKENINRLQEELMLYKKYSMYDVLKAMKYLVDIMRENKVIWGVGRGSSVASYALFLLGVHKIDSVKYNLSIDEFFKGENNG